MTLHPSTIGAPPHTAGGGKERPPPYTRVNAVHGPAQPHRSALARLVGASSAREAVARTRGNSFAMKHPPTRSPVPAVGPSRLKPLPQGMPAARPDIAALGLATLGANLRHRAPRRSGETRHSGRPPRGFHPPYGANRCVGWMTLHPSTIGAPPNTAGGGKKRRPHTRLNAITAHKIAPKEKGRPSASLFVTLARSERGDGGCVVEVAQTLWGPERAVLERLH